MQNRNLIIEQIPVGQYDNFVYLIGDRASGRAAVVDPAWDVPAIYAAAERLGLTIEAIWLTHAHGDHVEGIPAVLERGEVPVYLSPNEHKKYRPDMPLHDIGDSLTIGGESLQVFHTPGHSPGGVCFYTPGHLIAGDTIFINGCGRCDLVGSDPKAMFNSLHTVLWPLPDDTVVYPGHNYGPTPTDTLGNQKKSNRFFLANTLDAFIKERMG